MTLRKIIKNRGRFPSDESATKRNIFSLEKRRNKMDHAAKRLEKGLTQFAIIYKDRVPAFGT